MLEQITGIFSGFGLLQQIVAVVALILIVLLYVALKARKRAGAHRMPIPKAQLPRLAVMESAIVDEKRRLMLIRRDQVEHLVLMGGPTDLVIESNIVKSAPQADGHHIAISPEPSERAKDKARVETIDVAAPPPAVAALAPNAKEPTADPEPEKIEHHGMAHASVSPSRDQRAEPAPSSGLKPLQAGFNPASKGDQAVSSTPEANGKMAPSHQAVTDTPSVAVPPRAPEPQVRTAPSSVHNPPLSRSSSGTTPSAPKPDASPTVRTEPKPTETPASTRRAEPVAPVPQKTEPVRPTAENATIIGTATQPRWNAPSHRSAQPAGTHANRPVTDTPAAPIKTSETGSPSISAVDEDFAIGLEEAMAVGTQGPSSSPAPTHEQFSQTLGAQNSSHASQSTTQQEKSLEDEMASLLDDFGTQQSR